LPVTPLQVVNELPLKKKLSHSPCVSSPAPQAGDATTDISNAPSAASVSAKTPLFVRVRLAAVEVAPASVLGPACLLCLASLRWRIGLLLVIR
jgi:hypothetical protein